MRTRRFRSLEERITSVEGRLRESVCTYRPDVLAVVVGRRHDRTEEVGRRVVDIAATLPVSVVIIDVDALEELFRCPGDALLDQLGQAVTGAFFPELVHRTGSWRLGDDDLRRPLRPVWRATAGAISVLAHHRPETVRALARGPLPPVLASLIERQLSTPV